jgi:hypothetical protein
MKLIHDNRERRRMCSLGRIVTGSRYGEDVASRRCSSTTAL